MNRKAFLALLGGFLGALALVSRSKATVAPLSPIEPKVCDSLFPISEHLSKFEAIEVCGVPVYCDPYCDPDAIHVMRRRPSRDNLPLLCESEDFDHLTAVEYITGAIKRNGSTPDLVVVHPKRWTELLRDELARSAGQRWVTTANV